MAERQYRKLVFFPIRVSVGNYCWGNGRICPQFDCEGGHPHCAMGFEVKFHGYNTHAVQKPEKCLELKDA